MGTSRFSYLGFGVDWITKSDIYDVGYMWSLGVFATLKQMKAALPNCACGWITVGGSGHAKHVRVYSLAKLRSIFPPSS